MALALCALLLPVTASAKHQVTRPFKFHAEQTIIIDFMSGTWTIVEEIGEATHFGRYTCSGGGTFDSDLYLTGSGEQIAANGDKVFWEIEGPPFILTYAGGTGRFEGATGSATLTITAQTMLPDPEFPWLLTITQSFTGIGTIKY